MALILQIDNTKDMKRFLLIPISIIGLFFFSACETGAQTETGQIVEVDVNQAEDLIAEGGIQLVDVRTKGEVFQGYIGGAQHIDFMQWDAFTEEVKNLDKSQPVMVYCKVGGRSHKAAVYLTENGFEKVYDIKGGIDAWNREGKTLTTD